MAKFMYLFRSNPAAYRSMSAEQMQQTMKKWMDWKEALEKNGNIKQLGERLDGTGKVVPGWAPGWNIDWSPLSGPVLEFCCEDILPKADRSNPL